MPTTNNDTILRNTLCQRKTQVGAEIFDRIEGLIPLEKSDVQSLNFEAMSHPVFGNILDGPRTDPFCCSLHLDARAHSLTREQATLN